MSELQRDSAFRATDTAGWPDRLRGYLHHPTIFGDRVCFVSEDDLWVVDAIGGAASRLTVSVSDISNPAYSPDGTLIAFVGQESGDKEAYCVSASGGSLARLTYLGIETVAGWTPEGNVCATSAYDQPFISRSGRHGGDRTWAYSIPLDGAPPERLPYGPVSALGFGAGGAMVLGRNGGDPAWWKRYRGGTAGQVWARADEGASWRQLFTDLAGNLVCPMLVHGRVYFLSDHGGISNLYSATLSGSDLVQHTRHDDFFARWASTDGRRIVYQQGADIWLFDPSADQTSRIEIVQNGSRPQRSRRFVDAEANLTGLSVSPHGRSIVLTVRTKPVVMDLFEGAVRQLGKPQGVRYRLSRWCGEDGDIVTLSDDGGEDRLELYPVDGSEARVLQVDGVSNLVDLAASPDGTKLALATLDRRLVVVDVADGSAHTIDESSAGWIVDLTWSPDSAYVAYSYPESDRTSSIRICASSGGAPIQVTAPQFFDFQPRFDPSGKWLAFLSKRVFDPVPDGVVFTYGFPKGVRPYVVTLHADERSPLRSPPRSMSQAEKSDSSGSTEEKSASEGDRDFVPSIRIDSADISDRVQVVEAPEARYLRLEIIGQKMLLLAEPVRGTLGTDWTNRDQRGGRSLESYDLVERRHEVILSDVRDFSVARDGSTLVVRNAKGLRAMVPGKKPPEDTDRDNPGRQSGWLDLSRVRVEVDPGAEWRQMFKEAWRLQRDHFWDPGLLGIDWARVLVLYLPLVERVSTRAELSDLLWEMQGELGTSHAYELGGDRRQPPQWQMGRLGADFYFDTTAEAWRVGHIVKADSWDPDSASPLIEPGANITEGDAILAINGQQLSRNRPPGSALVNQAGQDVEIVVAGRTESSPRHVVVRALKSEVPGRYREWVQKNRAVVHERTDGRVGYVHIPDMGSPGFSEFHRAHLAEGERDALVVDVRHNGGGHVSALLLAKIAIPRIGEDISRWRAAVGYPEASIAGPMVAIADEWAGSDGDIFAQAFRSLRLGPVVGTRTWGGVIGIAPQLKLADGTITTQPEYAFWFNDSGWEVENHGVAPDEEVVISPEDWVTDRDPQLDRAIELVLEALAQRPPQHATHP